MEQYNKQNNYVPVQEEESIDYMKYVCKALKERKLIAKWCAVAAVIGVVMALSAVSTYTVKAVMAPEIAQKSGNSSLASLANIAGINLNNMTLTDAMYPDLYPEIVSSVPFITELFEMPVEFEYRKDTVKTNYYDYLTEYGKSTWYGAVLSLPGKALGAVIGLLSGKDDEEDGPSVVDPSHLTKKQEKAFKSLNERVNISVDKKTYLMTLTVTDQNPVIAAQLAQTIIDNLQKYVVSYRTEKSRHDLEYYEQLYNDARAEYFDAQQRYARYVDANQGVVLQRVLIERERLQNEASLKYQLYNTCAQQVQQAKAKVQLETPVCATLQPPTVPLQDNESGAKTLAVWIFLGFLFAVVWILWGREFWARLKSGELLADPEEAAADAPADDKTAKK